MRPYTYLQLLVFALNEILVIILADDFAILESVVLHAFHACELEAAAPTIGVREPVRENVGEGSPQPGRNIPEREAI